MNTNQLTVFINDLGQAAALVSCQIIFTCSRPLTFLQGSKVILGTCCGRMALCTFGRDLYPCRLLWRPLPNISELCVVSSFCGLHDRSVYYTGLASRYIRRSQNKTDCQLDRDSGECFYDICLPAGLILISAALLYDISTSSSALHSSPYLSVLP
jgi:hypothetical protein